MMASEPSLWPAIIGLIGALLGGAFLLVWSSLREHIKDDEAQHGEIWRAINSIRDDLAKHKVEVERRFVTADDIEKLRRELLEHLIRIERKLDTTHHRPVLAGE